MATTPKKRNVGKAKSKEADDILPTANTYTTAVATATTNPQPLKDTATSLNDEFERESFCRYCGTPEGLWKRSEEAIPGYTSESLWP